MELSRIRIIYNPCAGRFRDRRSSVNRLAAILREAGRTVEVCTTDGPHHATELARAAVIQGFDLVLAHGGDGTMNEVLQAVAGTETVLGFWPGGTANVLAKEIDFPSHPAEVARRILAGRVKRVTVGRANQRYFLLMAGIGLDATVVGNVKPHLKRRLGKGAFALSALQFIRRWHLEPLQVEVEGEETVGRFVVAGNSRTYGGGFRLTPQADLSDPALDLCIFSSHSRFDYLKYAFTSLFGAHHRLPGVTYRKVRRVAINGSGRGRVLVQIDGEVIDELPLVLESIPEGVHLLV